MLMEWLRQRDCVKTGLELFINHHHINNQTRRDAYVALLQGRVSEVGRAEVPALRRGRRSAERVAAGFIWIQMDAGAQASLTILRRGSAPLQYNITSASSFEEVERAARLPLGGVGAANDGAPIY